MRAEKVVGRALAIMALLLFAFAWRADASAQTRPGADRVSRVVLPVRVQLDGIATGALVTMLMRDVMKVPYVIAPDVLTDRAPVSVNLVMARNEIPTKVVGFLRGIGLNVEIIGGAVYVSRSGFGKRSAGGSAQLLPGQLPSAQSAPPAVPGQIVPGGSPLSQPAPLPGQTVMGQPVQWNVALPVTVAIIEPAHREPAEFVDVLETVLPDLKVSARDDVAPVGFEIRPTASPDRLVLAGTVEDIEKAVEVVRGLDLPRPSVRLSALVMEVSETEARGSALQVLADILGGGFGAGSYAGPTAQPQSVSIAVGGLTAVLSAVREDGRFSVIAEPRILVRSGSVATINAGSDVPTLGAVSLTENGQQFRSVEYRQSGITLTVRPVVIGEEIQLAVRQERSSFVATTTGVNDSPTLNQTTVESQLTLKPGETLALAGLDEKSASDTKSGLFGGLLGVKSRDKSNRQTVLVLRAELVEPIEPRSAVVTIIGEGKDSEEKGG